MQKKLVADFEHLLEQKMGLNPTSVGSFTIERAICERQSACGLPDFTSYWEYLHKVPAEMQELTEAVVVPETWFYREKEAFDSLVVIALERLRNNPGTVLRMLSLPCSSGEEPYSMAMALLDAGVSPNRFQIDAVDISHHALNRASQAVYGKNSFRGADISFRDRYFSLGEFGYRLSSTVKSRISLRHGNIFSPYFTMRQVYYDVVFCRNLLIYFDERRQKQCICLMARLLNEKGTLFVGASEAGLLSMHDFKSYKKHSGFGFENSNTSLPSLSAPLFLARERSKDISGRLALMPKIKQREQIAELVARPSLPIKAASSASRGVNSGSSSLDHAEQLANQGKLHEAFAICETELEREPKPRTFYLLGLICDTDGDQEKAASYYRKALYLEPLYPEALLQLAYLQEKQGMIDEANVLRERHQRGNRKQEV